MTIHRLRILDAEMRRQIYDEARRQKLNIYMPPGNYANFLETNDHDLAVVRTIVADFKNRNIMAKPPTPHSLLKGRVTKPDYRTRPITVTGDGEMMRAYLTTEDHKGVYNRFTIIHQLGELRSQEAHFQKEVAYLQEVINANGVTYSQGGLDLGLELIPAPETDVWAEKRRLAIKRKPSLKEQKDYIFTKEAAMEVREWKQSSLEALGRMCTILREQLAETNVPHDPLQQLIHMLEHMAGYTAFSFEMTPTPIRHESSLDYVRGPLIHGTTTMVTVKGVDLGIYHVYVSPRDNGLYIDGGSFISPYGATHAHVSNGRPCLGNMKLPIADLWDTHMYPLMFAALRELLNSWQESHYVNFYELTGKQPYDHDGHPAEGGQQLVMCTGGRGDEAHGIAQGDALYCDTCANAMCVQHSWRVDNNRYCELCYRQYQAAAGHQANPNAELGLPANATFAPVNDTVRFPDAQRVTADNPLGLPIHRRPGLTHFDEVHEAAQLAHHQGENIDRPEDRLRHRAYQTVVATPRGHNMARRPVPQCRAR